MRIDDQGAAWPRSEQELVWYVRGLLNGPVPKGHDYNTSGYAMAKAAAAAFNYIGSVLGCTGFQAGYAALMFLRGPLMLEGPYAIVDGSHLLYPQYNIEEKVRGWIEEWKPELAETARQKIASDDASEFKAHPDVRARWEEAARWDGS